MSVSHRRPPSRVRRALAGAAALSAIAAIPLASAGHAAVTRAPAPGLLANPDCVLIVPAHPLTAAGLAKPYRLASAGQDCQEANPATAAFVQATILEPGGTVAVYDPLVVTDGTQPAVPPIPPVIAPGSVVTLWTGFNGNVLRLAGPGARGFVNFAQQAYDNSPAFFAALASVAPPALGTAASGRACPSSRDFSIVDQDQSDNVPVTYLFNNAGQSAQDTTASRALLPAAIANGSDEQLLENVDSALGCTPWQAANLADPGQMTGSGALQEAQAAAHQGAPVALVPALDPFVTFRGHPSPFLMNLYRAQVDQPRGAGDTAAYCRNLAHTGAGRLQADYATETGAPAPSFAPIGTNLANVLAGRFAATWANLTCTALTGQPSPVTITTNAGGLVSGATYTPGP